MRVFHGFLWFLAIVIALVLALSVYDSVTHTYYSVAEAQRAGHANGYRYAPVIFAIAALVAVLGTWKGILPGTKRHTKDKRPPINYTHPQ
jgi:hypothetical protein